MIMNESMFLLLFPSVMVVDSGLIVARNGGLLATNKRGPNGFIQTLLEFRAYPS